MTRLTLLRGTVLTLFLSAFTCMPTLGEPVPRSINEIISLALKQSAELAALEKDAASKQSLAVQAGTISNPTLEVQGATGSLTGSPEERSVSIGVNQELSLNGKLRLRREAAQYEAEVAQLQRDNAVRLLKDEVGTLALEFVLISRRQELAADLVKLNRDLASITEERFKAGDISELELNMAKVELARAESRLLEVERERIPLRIKIASVTGLNENEINLSDKFSVPVRSPNYRDLVKHALVARPDLLALAREFDKAETENRLAVAEALPNLTAGIFVQLERGSTEVGGLSSTSSDNQLGLRVSMPIPVFDRNRGGRAAARSRLDAAGSRRLALERSIAAEVETAISRLSSAEGILRLFEQDIIPQLTENLRLTREAYQLGEVGILSVIDEQKKYFEVNDSYQTALHSRRMAITQLESAVASDLSGGVQ